MNFDSKSTEQMAVPHFSQNSCWCETLVEKAQKSSATLQPATAATSLVTQMWSRMQSLRELLEKLEYMSITPLRWRHIRQSHYQNRTGLHSITRSSNQHDRLKDGGGLSATTTRCSLDCMKHSAYPGALLSTWNW